MAVKSFQLNIIGRILIIIAAIICVYAVYTVIRWGFGHTIAQNTDSKEVAEYAIELAPYDSQTYYKLSSINEQSFLPDDWQKALADNEKAVGVSPNDYRLWIALGKIREHLGDSDGAEKALRKAQELAPNYSEVHWTFGNMLLRQGNIDEAFVQIRQAVENDSFYVQPAVQTAWQTFDGDMAQISQKIGDSTPIKAGLVKYLATQQKFDGAFAFWNSIPAEEKSTTYKKIGEELIGSLSQAKRFRDALTVIKQISPQDGEIFSVGSVFNGNFEKEVKLANASLLDWQIAEGSQPQISLDNTQKHSGNQSLVIMFNSKTGQEFRAVQQLVLVESGKTYKFETFYRSNLKALSTFKWEITDANDGKVLATTGETDVTTSDWSVLSASFTTLPTTQAVIIKFSPVPCKQGLCPISGKLWFDDISLK